ncbi:MAG: (Fe-S)-binding protein [Gemmatimonadaceae bacterium]|nr:(Fe-S)-binding protein [Gemmatimonadaceae bacterium]
MTVSQLVFAIVFVFALGFFSYSAQRLIAYLKIGKADPRTDHVGTRLKNLALIGFAQTKILRERGAGISHALVFWGFLVVTVGTAEQMVQGFVPSFELAKILPRPLAVAFLFSQELFALGILGAVSWLIYRRAFAPPRRLRGEGKGDPVHHGEAILILSIIATLMLTIYIKTGFELVAEPLRDAFGQPIAAMIAAAFAGTVDQDTAHIISRTAWWTHALLVLVFLNLLPYSKHLHVLTSLINTYFSNTSGPGAVGAMRPMDLEAETDVYGASDVEHLSWKALLDGYSCTECGRCMSVCPANTTGKMLSPRKIVVNVRQRLLEKGPLMVRDVAEPTEPSAAEKAAAGTVDEAAQKILGNRLLDSYITEEELWACTSCRACVYECPVSIDQLDVINELRRNLVLTESRFPEELMPAFEGLEQKGNPWSFNPGDRGAWAEGMDIPTMADLAARGEKPDVLFWVGCMGSFDERAKKITVAFARILQAAEVKFAILGQEEACHGDPARRMGNEYLYQVLAKGAIETLNNYGVQTIVTHCPHCFHQMGTEFPQFGGHYEVIHHSEYLERLLAQGRVPMQSGGDKLVVAYHDSCYLGRYHEIIEEPRAALKRALPVLTLVEPERTKSKGLCCGAGGGRMWMEEKDGKRINVERTEELLATGADTIAVACPFCMTMISDGVTAKSSDVPVMDLSEIVASRLAVPASTT